MDLLQAGRVAVEGMVVGGGVVSVDMAKWAMNSAGLVIIGDPAAMLVRLGFQIVADPKDPRFIFVRAAGLERAGGVPRLEVLRGVAMVVKAAPDPFRFAACLRMITATPDAPRLQGTYCQYVRRECKSAGLEILLKDRKCHASARAAVQALLTRTLSGWTRGIFPLACEVCGQRTTRVIDLGRPICSNLTQPAPGRDRPCYLSIITRPADHMLMEPLYEELS
jgi:hypothetical protein